MTSDPIYIPRFLDAAACCRIRTCMDAGAVEPAEILDGEIALDAAVRRARDRADGNHTISRRVAAGTPPILADRTYLLQSLDELIGQAAVRANLKVFVEAAKGRGEALDHVLFVGPPGLGKTTLAQIMARELGVNFRSTSGPSSPRRAILRHFSPISRTETSSSSTRSTGSIRRSRKSSIRRWRTISST